MSLRSYPSVKLLRYALCALLALIVVLLARTPAPTNAAAPPVLFQQNAAAYTSLLSKLSLVPPAWSVNVRANTDNTGNGQHEPSLAVSPANHNVIVIANKDYRDSDIKRVWIEASRDGGLTWPTQLHMPQLPTT